MRRTSLVYLSQYKPIYNLSPCLRLNAESTLGDCANRHIYVITSPSGRRKPFLLSNIHLLDDLPNKNSDHAPPLGIISILIRIHYLVQEERKWWVREHFNVGFLYSF